MANEILQKLDATITWSDGGSPDFSPQSLATASGRQGALHDLGVASTARRFVWRAWLKPGATRVVGQTVDLYLKTSDGTHPDNDDGTGDIAVSAQDKLRNLTLIGLIEIDEDAAVEMVASGTVEVWGRHVAPVFWNSTANTLSSTGADFGFTLTELIDEIQ